MRRICTLFMIVFTLTSYAQSISTDTVLTMSTCSGQNIFVRYTTTGAFVAGTKFRAEMSNAFGSFSNPTVIGNSNFNMGIIMAKIPSYVSFGIYRIRVVATNPAVIGTTAPNPVFISSFPQMAQIMASNTDTACYGEKVSLSVLQGIKCSWSTGETTNEIDVIQGGTYWVKTIDLGGCEGSDTIVISFKDCSTVGVELMTTNSATYTIFPNPASDKLTVMSQVGTASLVEIYDFSGSKKISQAVIGKSEININSLSKGLYIVKIKQQDNGVNPVVLKFVKI